MNNVLLTEVISSKGKNYKDVREELSRKLKNRIKKTKELSLEKDGFNLGEQFHNNHIFLRNFNVIQNKHKRVVSEISEETDLFYSTYKKVKSKSPNKDKYNDRQDGPFKDILKQYDLKNIKPPFLKDKNNLFKLTPLLLNNNKIDKYYKQYYVDKPINNIEKNTKSSQTVKVRSMNLNNNNSNLITLTSNNSNNEYYEKTETNCENNNVDKSLKYISELNEVYKQKKLIESGIVASSKMSKLKAENDVNKNDNLNNEDNEILYKSKRYIKKENKKLKKYIHDINNLMKNEEFKEPAINTCPNMINCYLKKELEIIPSGKKKGGVIEKNMFLQPLSIMKINDNYRRGTMASLNTLSNTHLNNFRNNLKTNETLKDFVTKNKENKYIGKIYNKIKYLTSPEKKDRECQNFNIRSPEPIRSSNQIENLFGNIKYTKENIFTFHTQNNQQMRKLYFDFGNSKNYLFNNIKNVNDKLYELDEELIKTTTIL